MSVLSNLQQQSEPVSSPIDSPPSETLRLLETITEKLVDLEEQQRRLAASISALPKSDSNERLSAIEKTLLALSETVSAEKQLKTADGKTVKASDVDAMTLVRKLETTTTALASEVKANTQAVKAKAQVKLDAEKVARIMTQRVVAAQTDLLTKHSDRTKAILDAQAARLDEIGTTKAGEIAQEARAATQALDRASSTVDRLERVATWQTVGKVVTALIPVLLVVLIVGSLCSAATQALGFGPILGWWWALFEATGPWYVKIVVALIGLGFVAGLVVLCGWLAGVVRRLWDR